MYPVGLIDEQSGAATPDFFELEQSLAIVRASTWDQEAIKKERRRLRERKREEEKKAEAAGVVQEDNVMYEERRKTNTDDDLDEVRERLKVCCMYNTCIHVHCRCTFPTLYTYIYM